MHKSVLIVGKRDTCRTPIAEGFLKRMRPEIVVETAGTFEGVSLHLQGCTPDIPATMVMDMHGIDIRQSASRILSKVNVDKFPVIVCMDENIASTFKTASPNYAGKIIIAGGKGIKDPSGQGLQRYKDIAKEIEIAILNIAQAYFTP